MSWRTRNLNEVKFSQGQGGTHGTPTAPPLDHNFHLTLISDVLNLSLGETNPTDPYVLQMNFGTSTLGGGQSEIVALLANHFLYLAWLNPNGFGGSPEWQNAVNGNTSNNASPTEQAFLGSFAQFQAANGTTLTNYMGAWGVDPTTDNAWAVLDHASNFAVVPEPSTYALAAFGLLELGGLWVIRRRKSASAVSR